MRNVLSIMVIVFAFFLAFPATAGKVEGAGQEWLDQHKDAPQMNVTGTWESQDWNNPLSLTQSKGSREVSGSDKKFELSGVVSGKSLFLLFANSKGSVSFCATLNSDSDGSLSGTYSYHVTRLKLGHGLCQEKSYPLRMKRSSPTAAK